MRFNELANLRVREISVQDLYVSVNIQKSKTDVYRRENDVLIASAGNKTCSVVLVEEVYSIGGHLTKARWCHFSFCLLFQVT